MVNVRSRSIERLAGQTSIFGFSTRQLRNGVFGQERAGGGAYMRQRTIGSMIGKRSMISWYSSILLD